MIRHLCSRRVWAGVLAATITGLTFAALAPAVAQRDPATLEGTWLGSFSCEDWGYGPFVIQVQPEADGEWSAFMQRTIRKRIEYRFRGTWNPQEQAVDLAVIDPPDYKRLSIWLIPVADDFMEGLARNHEDPDCGAVWAYRTDAQPPEPSPHDQQEPLRTWLREQVGRIDVVRWQSDLLRERPPTVLQAMILKDRVAGYDAVLDGLAQDQQQALRSKGYEALASLASQALPLAADQIATIPLERGLVGYRQAQRLNYFQFSTPDRALTPTAEQAEAIAQAANARMAVAAREWVQEWEDPAAYPMTLDGHIAWARALKEQLRSLRHRAGRNTTVLSNVVAERIAQNALSQIPQIEGALAQLPETVEGLQALHSLAQDVFHVAYDNLTQVNPQIAVMFAQRHAQIENGLFGQYCNTALAQVDVDSDDARLPVLGPEGSVPLADMLCGIAADGAQNMAFDTPGLFGSEYTLTLERDGVAEKWILEMIEINQDQDMLVGTVRERLGQREALSPDRFRREVGEWLNRRRSKALYDRR